MFASNEDGTFRIYVNYCKLNAVNIREAYPIPCMDESIDSLSDATIFSTLDTNSSYCLVRVADENLEKSTFASHHELFWIIRMPFGLKLTRDASTRDGRHPLLSGVSVCTALSQRYFHIFKVPRQTYRTCTTGLDVIERCWYNTKTEKLAISTIMID